MLATKKGDQVREFKKGVMPFLVILGFTSLLILLQPNMSMAVLVSLLGGIVLFTAGAKIGHFLLLGTGAVIAALQLIQLEGYRSDRINKFLNGADGMTQIHQSLVGVGSGGCLRRRLRAGAAEVRLRPLRLFGFHLQRDRRGVGLPRRSGHGHTASESSAGSGSASRGPRRIPSVSISRPGSPRRSESRR